MTCVQRSVAVAIRALEHSDNHIFKGVQAVMCDPPYSTRQIAEPLNLQHSRLGLQDMRDFVQFLFVLMDLGAHGLLFCSALQFKMRYGFTGCGLGVFEKRRKSSGRSGSSQSETS